MDEQKSGPQLDFEQRLYPPKGRPIRDRMAGIRVSEEELAKLEGAAKAEGKLLAEWVRDVLLRETRKQDHALFTELIATRLLLFNLLKPIALGQTLDQDGITEIMTVVRREKQRAARELMEQYAVADEIAEV